MADTITPPTVLNFNDDTDRAASCLAEIQRTLRKHRFEIDVSEWLAFNTTDRPKDSHDLFESNWVDWMGADGKALDLQTIHDLARERLRQPC